MISFLLTSQPQFCRRLSLLALPEAASLPTVADKALIDAGVLSLDVADPEGALVGHQAAVAAARRFRG